MPERGQFQPYSRRRRPRALGPIAVIAALVVLGSGAGAARADDPVSAAQDQYGQQPVLLPPTTPSGQTPTVQTQIPESSSPPATQTTPSSPATTQPPAIQTTPSSPATTQPTTTPASTTPNASAGTATTPKAPFTPPKTTTPATQSAPQTSAPPATPAATQGGTLPFTGIPLLDVVLFGVGLIALGAVLRVPRTRFRDRP